MENSVMWHYKSLNQKLFDAVKGINMEQVYKNLIAQAIHKNIFLLVADIGYGALKSFNKSFRIIY